MLKSKKKLTGFLLAAVMLSNTMAGAAPMISYADENTTVNFKTETVCSQDEVFLPKYIPANAATMAEINTAVYFVGEDDKTKWLNMSKEDQEKYLESNAVIASDNPNIEVTTKGYIRSGGLTSDGKGTIVNYSAWSKTPGEQGNISFQLGAAKAKTAILDVVERFGSNSNVSGSVEIVPVTFEIKQKEKRIVEIKSIGGVNATDVQWYSSNPEMIAVNDLKDGRAEIEGKQLFPFINRELFISIYAVVTDATGVKIVEEKMLTVKEGDPEFTLTSQEDKEFTLNPGDKKAIGVTIFPENASVSMGNVTVTSDEPNVAAGNFDYTKKQIQVTAGNVEGTAVLTVKAKINNTDCDPVTIKVHVEDPNKKIEIMDEGAAAENVLLDISEADGKKLTYQTIPADATVTDISWTTNDDAIEIVNNEDGTTSILPLNPGKAEVQLTATVNGGIRHASCQVYVLTDPEITLTADGEEKDSVFLLPEGKTVLEAVTNDGYPEALKAKTVVSWESSDPSIASTSNAARTKSQTVVKAAVPGDAKMTVTVTTEIPGVNGSERTAEKSLSIEVEEVELQACITPENMLLKKGRTGSVTAEVKADTDREERPVITNVSWYTGNKKVVAAKASQIPSVAEVKGVGKGETTIGADIAVMYGGLSQEIKATPSNASVTLEQVPEFSFEDKTVTVRAGQETEVMVKATPSDAMVNSVTWISSEPEIADVEGEDLNAVVTGHKKGTVVLTAVATADVNGEIQNIPVQGQILVTVTEDEVSFYIKPNHLTVKAGEESEISLSTKASPSNAEYEILDVQWETDKESTAGVTGDEEGATVTGEAEGTTVVKAIISIFINGREEIREATSKVTVTEDVLNLKIAPEKLSLKEGESGTLRLSSSHESAITNISWNSDSQETAVVKASNESGTEAVVTAVKKGEAVVTVKVTAFINGRQEARTLTVPVTVSAAGTDTEDVLNLKIAPEKLSLKEGERGTLRLSSSHESAITNISWDSDSQETAVVKASNESGTEAVVTAVKKGEAVVTVKVTAFINGRQVTRTLIVPVTVSAEDNNDSGNTGSSSGSSSGSSNYTDSSSTSVLTGTWQKDDRGWWFKQTSGAYAVNQWGKINNLWYYFGSDGYMVTGWQYVNGSWYYLNTEEIGQGAMKTDWFFDSQVQKWFYLNNDGAMVTDWQKIDGYWYYFNPVSDGTCGTMAVNTWIGSYYVNSDGVWVQ